MRENNGERILSQGEELFARDEEIPAHDEKLFTHGEELPPDEEKQHGAEGKTMTNDNYIPTIEQNRVAWFNNFVTVATANVTLLAFTPADMTALSGGVGGYNTAVNISTTARTAYHAATKSKITANKTATATVRGLVRRVQSNPAVTPGLKVQLQINPKTTPRTKTAPVTPTNLLATPDADGTNTLTWSGNGNKRNTTYIIEAMIGSATNFVYVDDTTAQRFAHTGQTPGVTVVYRVTASRAKMKSAPSQTAAVYLHSPAVFLTLSKAA